VYFQQTIERLISAVLKFPNTLRHFHKVETKRTMN